VVAGLALAAAPATVLATADDAHAQDKQTEKSLYERLGGVSRLRRWSITSATLS